MDDRSIALEGVSKTYGGRAALTAVRLTAKPGEMLALIGPSGSGKSTLLRVAAGLVTADKGSGSARLGGLLVQEGGKLAREVRSARARVGVIFQQFNLVDRLTVFANAAIGALGRLPTWRGALGLFPKADRTAAMAALARVGLAEQAGQRAGTLSGGQKQRAAIARALVQNAGVILADEPIASLDPVSARKIMDLLSELNRRDAITVVVTLHQIDYALRYCARIVALKEGRIVYDGPADGLSREHLVEIYGREYEDAFWQGEAA